MAISSLCVISDIDPQVYYVYFVEETKSISNTFILIMNVSDFYSKSDTTGSSG